MYIICSPSVKREKKYLSGNDDRHNWQKKMVQQDWARKAEREEDGKVLTDNS